MPDARPPQRPQPTDLDRRTAPMLDRRIGFASMLADFQDQFRCMRPAVKDDLLMAAICDEMVCRLAACGLTLHIAKLQGK